MARRPSTANASVRAAAQYGAAVPVRAAAQYGPPPQYGQPPQYGPPRQASPYETPQYAAQSQPGQPYQYQAQQPGAKKSRKKLAAFGGAFVVVVLIAGGADYAATHGARQLSHTAVEKSIETQSTDTSKSFRVVTGVDCNGGKNIKVAKNASFTCTADDNVKITVVIESASSDPDWVWAVD